MSWRDSASGSSDWHGGGNSAGNSGPSGAGTGGNYGGSNGNSYSLTGGLGGGVTTGKTWYGNTVFGPAGGIAQGYATVVPGRNFGMGPSNNKYSNFKTTSGAAMFSGGPSSVTARNAAQAYGMMQALNNARTIGFGTGPAGGPITSGPLRQMGVPMPASAFPGYAPYPNSAFAGGWINGPNWNNFAGTWPGNNSTFAKNNLGNPGYGPSYNGPGSTHYKTND